MAAILHQELGWHDTFAEGSLTTKLALDAQNIQDGMGDNMSSTLSSAAMVLTGFAIAFSKSWKLALVMYVLFPFLEYLC